MFTLCILINLHELMVHNIVNILRGQIKIFKLIQYNFVGTFYFVSIAILCSLNRTFRLIKTI